MKKYLLLSLLAFVVAGCDDADDKASECKADEAKACKDSNTAYVCKDGAWTEQNCANGCDSATRACKAGNSTGGGESGTGGGESGTGGGSGSENMNFKNEWWANYDISKVNPSTDNQNNAPNSACTVGVFRESCNADGVITYCDEGTVKSVNCISKGFEACAYYPKFNIAECVMDMYKCSKEGDVYQGCAHDNDNYIFYSNDYCAKTEKGDLYWIEDIAYCSGVCSESKGCKAEKCNSNKYNAYCEGTSYGYECYDNDVITLDCKLQNKACGMTTSGPICE